MLGPGDSGLEWQWGGDQFMSDVPEVFSILNRRPLHTKMS